jgi:outer membrane lipoprotein carrier protein
LFTISLLAATFLPAPLSAQEHGPARASLETFSAGLNTLQAEFNQTITGPGGQVESRGAGRVWLARPGKFRWVYEGEFPELIVADGDRVWMFDQLLEQVTVKPQSSLAQDSPLMLLTDLTGLDDRFQVRELGKFEDLDLLELVSAVQEPEFERVLLGLDQSHLRLMVMEDAFGLRTELRFDEVQRNPELSEDLFRFDPPAGVDVVGDTGNLD